MVLERKIESIFFPYLPLLALHHLLWSLDIIFLLDVCCDLYCAVHSSSADHFGVHPPIEAFTSCSHLSNGQDFILRYSYSNDVLVRPLHLSHRIKGLP